MSSYHYDPQNVARRQNYEQAPSHNSFNCHHDKMKGTSDSLPHDIHREPIAMAYVPAQQWRDIVNAQDGFHTGTIFRELMKPLAPFVMKRGDRT